MPVLDEKKIRLLVVDDSLVFRAFLSKAFSDGSGIEVVGSAADAFEAERMIAELNPHVVTLDMEMPKMRGAEFLRSVLVKYPGTKAVVISAIPNNVFEALQAGAVDFVSKPNTRSGFDNDAFVLEAESKIKIAYAVSNLFRKRKPKQAFQTAQPAQAAHLSQTSRYYPAPAPQKAPQKTVVAIGASTGGTEAIADVLRNLPPTVPGLVIVQHMPPVFTQMYAERLDKICRIRVREAKDGDRVESGLALIAAGDRHMRLRKDITGYYVRCEGTDKVSGHCPSVDALFYSVAAAAGANAIGVIMTGMGADGAKGLLEMKKAGAHTIGQDEESCVVYGMPMMAYNGGAVKEQCSLKNIADAVLRRVLMK